MNEQERTRSEFEVALEAAKIDTQTGSIPRPKDPSKYAWWLLLSNIHRWLV